MKGLAEYWFKVALALLAILGALAGAVAIERTLWFLLALAAATIATALRFAVPEVRKRLKWMGSYPGLLRVHGELTKTVDGLRSELEIAQRAATLARFEGRRAGHRDAIGAMLASGIDGLSIEGVTLIASEVALVTGTARGRLKVGARFYVMVRLTPSPMGIVEVTSVDDGAAVLRCVERTNKRFWRELESRVDIDTSPPPNAQLTPFVLPSGDEGPETGDVGDDIEDEKRVIPDE